MRRGFRKVLAVFFLISTCSVQAQETCAAPQIVADADFAPGQVWSYRSRLGEENSTIAILKVESLPKVGTVIHIRISEIHLRRASGDPGPSMLRHVPIQRAPLKASVLRLKGTVEVPADYREGYAIWLADCGGVYTISPAEIVAANERTLNRGERTR